jgi:NADPH:quinone reductase-like Zn-dependent oxidoreductase
MFAVQIAKTMGATVTGVCSTAKMEMVRSLGADHVVDYTKDDVTTNGETYDVILDAGAYRSTFDYTRSLAPTGVYVLVGGEMKRTWQMLLLGRLRSKKGGKQYTMFVARANRPDLAKLAELMDQGTLRPVIGARYPLAHAAEAVSIMEQGKAVGKVVITVSE